MVRSFFEPPASPEETAGPILTKFGTDALQGERFWAIEAIFEIRPLSQDMGDFLVIFCHSCHPWRPPVAPITRPVGRI